MNDKIIKDALLAGMESTADYRREKGNEYPSDVRNMSCAKALDQAMEIVSKLPMDHPLFSKLEKANELGMERWSEYEVQFLSRWGYFDDATPADSGFRFVADLAKFIDKFIDEEGAK